MDSKLTEARIVLVSGIMLALLMFLRPDIDLAVSAWFYGGAGEWRFSNDMPLAGIPYRWIPRLAWLTLALALLILIVGGANRLRQYLPQRSGVIFLLSALLLGPVLLVDVGLKGHSGRARPLAIEQFGGSREFSAAFEPARQCEWNCAFVSGHVATASFIMAFGWLNRRRRAHWLAASLLLGAYTAWARIAVGAHFLSDTIFAWYAIYFALWFTELLLRKAGVLPRKCQPSEKIVNQPAMRLSPPPTADD